MSNMVTQPRSLADITFEPLLHKRKRGFCPAGGSTAVFRCFGIIRCHFFSSSCKTPGKFCWLENVAGDSVHIEMSRKWVKWQMWEELYIPLIMPPPPPPHTVSAEVALVLKRGALISLCLISVGRILTLKLLPSAFRRANAGGRGALLRPSGRRTEWSRSEAAALRCCKGRRSNTGLPC